MPVEQTIKNKLIEAFAPLHLAVGNESHRHAGHREMLTPGAAQSGETHFSIYIVSAAFAGKPRLERHRLINTVLAQELAGPVHALAIKAAAPGE